MKMSMFSPRDLMRNQKGFSLLELVTVMAVISVMTAIAFISILHYRTLIRVNTTARDLGGHMRMARAKSIKMNTPVYVQFMDSGTTHRYIIGEDPDMSRSPYSPHTYYLQPGIVFGYYSGIANVPNHRYPVNCAIDIQNCAQKWFHFMPDGTASHQGVVYVAPQMDTSGTGLRDDRNRAVDWISMTGSIRVWKYNPPTAGTSYGAWR
ncbi:MAG TPA: prepilin-type N-terminal cleavage/methylation domain-containing protein [bacterium]|nr:prepilin-type N-terminal cleavage/methylation domain-containing protein [bacterium]